MLARIVLSIIALGILTTAVALHRGALRIPEHLNPWATLSLDADPNLLTRYKLGRLSKDPELCQQILAGSTFRYERLTDRTTGPACGFHNAVRIDQTSATLTDSFSLSCRAAVSLALWERHVLQPTAQSHFAQPVTRLEHFGSYSCRNVYGRANATRSQHAMAEALDVAGFVLADGRRIRVATHWRGGADTSAFLRSIRAGACRFFDGVLSPDYNEAHHDHFHLDRGPYRMCR